MIYKIDCHVHSHHSDGLGDITQLAEKAMALGHCALVITDHDCSTTAAYRCAQAEIKTLRAHGKLPAIPIILGAEIHTPAGECLLFGGPAIRKWYFFQDHLKYVMDHFSVNAWVRLFQDYVLLGHSYTLAYGRTFVTKSIPHLYGLVLCHPREDSYFYRTIPKTFWEMCHGFEIQNGRKNYLETTPDVVETLRDLMPGSCEMKNSDAHAIADSRDVCNEVPFEIKEENQLVKWIKSNRKQWLWEGLPSVIDKIILEEHRRGVEFTQKMMEGMETCPPAYLEVITKNFEDLLA